MPARVLRMVGFTAMITVAVMLPIAVGAADESGCRKPYIENGYETHRTGKPLLFPRTQYRVGVTVFLSCNIGYTMEGSREIQCGPGSEWNQLLPYCVPVSCPQPNVPNAFIAAESGEGMTWETEYIYLDTVQLQCDIGYRMRGRREILCGSDGKWSDLPACQPVFCPEPEVKNGSITHKYGSEIPLGGDYRYSDMVTVRCDTGYIVRGGSEIWCQADGKWSALPTCERADCGPPTSLQFAEPRKIHSDKDSFPVGSTVTYSCLPGYVRISGTISATTCKEDSQWSEISEFCRPRTCGRPGEVQSGWFEVTDHFVGSLATLVCYKGYRIAGSSNFRRCLETGVWSNDVPNCEPVFCQRPPDMPNAIHSGMHIDNFAYLASVSYDCKIGALHGAQSIYCTENGNWSAPAPECIDVSCPVPSVQNGILKHGFASQVPYGEIMEFQCNTGYMPEHNSTIRCGRDGMWHPAYPVCVPYMSCPVPIVRNGILQGGFASHVSYGDSVKFQCNQGFSPDQSITIYCGKDGKWYPAYPVCVPITCPTPEVKNGYIQAIKFLELRLGAGYTYLNMLLMVCEVGFKMRGPLLIKCEANGNWSPHLPTCEPVSCHRPFIKHGNLILSKDGEMASETFTGTVTVQCNAGYVIRGESEIRCNVYGRLSAVPTCDPVICPLPESGPAHYILVPFRHLHMPSGYKLPERVKVYCETGYVIKGNSEIWCEEDGQWSSTPPTCEPVSCPTPDVRHGQISKSNGDLRMGLGYKFKDSVTVQCDAGYMVCGGKEIRCEADGKWSPTVPTCVPVSVTEHHSTPIPGLQVQKLLNAGVADEGSTVCHDQFLPLGRQEFTCLEKDTVDPAITRVVPVSSSALCESVGRSMKDHWQKMNVEDKYLHLGMGKLCLDIISLHLHVEKLNATLTPQAAKLNATFTPQAENLNATRTPSKLTWWQRITSIGFS